MSHIAVIGTQSTFKGCDLRRINGDEADHVTPAIGTADARQESRSRVSFSLLVGRYLHTTSASCEHVSTVVVGNESREEHDSTAQPGCDRVPVGNEDCRRRSGWLAADLRAVEAIVSSGDHLTARLGTEGMTELPATIRAERSAINTAGCAPTDIGVAEVHDSSTRTELISYEGVGFAEPTILEGPVTDGR